MTPGRTFTSRSNGRSHAKRNLPDANAYMAQYDRQRRYYFRDDDNSGYRHEELQFESTFIHNPLHNSNFYSNFTVTPT